MWAAYSPQRHAAYAAAIACHSYAALPPRPTGRLLQGLNEDCQTIQLGIGEKVGCRCSLLPRECGQMLFTTAGCRLGLPACVCSSRWMPHHAFEAPLLLLANTFTGRHDGFEPGPSHRRHHSGCGQSWLLKCAMPLVPKMCHLLQQCGGSLMCLLLLHNCC